MALQPVATSTPRQSQTFGVKEQRPDGLEPKKKRPKPEQADSLLLFKRPSQSTVQYLYLHGRPNRCFKYGVVLRECRYSVCSSGRNDSARRRPAPGLWSTRDGQMVPGHLPHGFVGNMQKFIGGTFFAAFLRSIFKNILMSFAAALTAGFGSQSFPCACSMPVSWAGENCRVSLRAVIFCAAALAV